MNLLIIFFAHHLFARAFRNPILLVLVTADLSFQHRNRQLSFWTPTTQLVTRYHY
ncbi:hypothetical protein HanIR_Chr01g0031121 [Helianthus annuus]|nr:hypothetical protein HanIR_Chr01g0031121 [Helianthus annuus]